MDIARMSVVGRGEAGRLTPKLLAVLLCLADRPGDREVEAEGRVEERGQDPEETDVETEKVEVKDEHGDYGRAGGPVEHNDR